jgi:hypothetical protein
MRSRAVIVKVLLLLLRILPSSTLPENLPSNVVRFQLPAEIAEEKKRIGQWGMLYGDPEKADRVQVVNLTIACSRENSGAARGLRT